MSQDAADGRKAAARRCTPVPPVSAAASGEMAPPQPALFTARTDTAGGTICTRGHLDLVGAEALCRVAVALQQLGHRHIGVYAGSGATADVQASTLLVELAQDLAAEGIRVTIG